MNSQLYVTMLFIYSYCSQLTYNAGEGRQHVSRGFLVYRTVSITQKSCTCATPNSCSCCQNVIILYTKAEKSLCVNFGYQTNGLNVDVTLSSDTIRARTITDYKPFRFCVYVPGCLFSSVCVNVLELNQFPRSITACLRFDIYSKKHVWQINYDCVSLSTELPAMPDNGTTRTADSTIAPEEMPEMTTEGMEEPAEVTSTTTVTMSEPATEGGITSADATTTASEMTTEETEMSETTVAQMEDTTTVEVEGTTAVEMEDTTTVQMEDSTTVEMTTDETIMATAETTATNVEMIDGTIEVVVDVEIEEMATEPIVDTMVVVTP